MAFPDGWTKYKEITITEQGGGNYNSFPTIIDVAWDSDMQTDFDDIRFTESDLETLIDYGLISKTDGVTAKFVILRNYTASGEQTVCVCYGNPSASSAAVDYTTWVTDWYDNNGFGGGTCNYTNTNCSLYPHTKQGDIPSWAGDVYLTRYNGYERAYYGRCKINGSAIKYATAAVCAGLAGRTYDQYGLYYYNDDSFNHAGWVKGGSGGASNTVIQGHYQAGSNCPHIVWLPVLPSIIFGAEQQLGGEIFNELGLEQVIKAVIEESDSFSWNELSLEQIVKTVTDESDSHLMSEAEREQIIKAVVEESDNQQMVELSREQVIKAVLEEIDSYQANEISVEQVIRVVVGKTDSYSANETSREAVILVVLEETDSLSLSELSLEQIIKIVLGECDIMAVKNIRTLSAVRNLPAARNLPASRCGICT